MYIKFDESSTSHEICDFNGPGKVSSLQLQEKFSQAALTKKQGLFKKVHFSAFEVNLPRLEKFENVAKEVLRHKPGKKNYFTKITDPKITTKESADYIQPSPAGLDLAIQYYFHKYGTNIVLIDNVEKLIEVLSKTDIRQKSGNFRQTFVVGANTKHAIPITYIKEEGEETILFADSKGNTEQAIEISKALNILVLATEIPRQSDIISCYLEAVLMGRDITALNSERNDFRIHNLLKLLNDKRTVMLDKNGMVFGVNLPVELLKTTQREQARIINEAEKNKSVNSQNLTHEQFLKKYQEKIELYWIVYGTMDFETGEETDEIQEFRETKVVNSYLRKKGIQFVDIIETQFYIDQIEFYLGYQLSDEKHSEFIELAKQHLQKNDQNVLSANRKGLHDVAENFLTNELIKTSDSESTPSTKLSK